MRQSFEAAITLHSDGIFCFGGCQNAQIAVNPTLLEDAVAHSGCQFSVDVMQGPFSNEDLLPTHGDSSDTPFAAGQQSPSVAGIPLDLTDAVISQPTGTPPHSPNFAFIIRSRINQIVLGSSIPSLMQIQQSHVLLGLLLSMRNSRICIPSPIIQSADGRISG